MTLTDATHIVYPTRPRTAHVLVTVFMLREGRWEGWWTGRLALWEVTSIRDALEAHVWCLPPGRLYVNGVCVCEFGRGLVTRGSDNPLETTL